MNSSTLRIVSIVQPRVDALLKDIFDLCKSSDSSATESETLSSTIATGLAICDSVQVAIQRRRNDYTLFGRLDTDIVHSIFESTLDLDRVHSLSLEELSAHRDQLFLLRQVSSTWNDFLLSSPRYWQVIDIKSPPQVITAILKRSGSAQLCVYCCSGHPPPPPIHLVPEELQSCARVQSLLSYDHKAYYLHRWLLQGPMPALRNLALTGMPEPMEETGPIGDLPSIQKLVAISWLPPSDAAWPLRLKELILGRKSAPDIELLRVISACANIEQLVVFGKNDEVDVGELSGSIAPITLPRLKHMDIKFTTHESVARLIRVLVAPQCLRRILRVRQALHLSRYVADYSRFMPLEDRYAPTQYPEFASILIQGSTLGTNLEYETKGHRASFEVCGEEEVPAFQDLVQRAQASFKGPPITLTIRDPLGPTWLFFKSLGDQNIKEIVAYCPRSNTETSTLLKSIGTDHTNPPGGPTADTATDCPFKSLASIEIHNAYVDLLEFAGLVEEYLPKSSRPVLEEIVLVRCRLQEMKLAQAAERLAAIGITLSKR